MKSDKDRFSTLPDDIIDNILVRMPLEKAINTSLLSTTWRYKWRSTSEININSLGSFEWRSMLSEFNNGNMEKLGNKVFRFMLLHRGNIQSFALNDWLGCFSFSDINILLDHLIGHQIQQLMLKLGFSNEDYYLIPSLVFSFDKLITLDIKYRFMIKLPSSFDGFKSLTSLVLHCIKFATATTLQRLIDLSPLLKHLDLRFYDYPTLVYLNTPNLHVLKYHGPFSHLNFMHTPLIAKVSLSRIGEHPYDLPNLLGSLSKVSNLQLSATDFCPVESALKEIKFNLLKTLHLTVCLDCPLQYVVVDCILENSPALVHLQITTSEPKIWWTSSSEIENISLKFKHIKTFDININSGSTSEMKFIKYVLRNSPLLKVVNVILIGYLVELSIEKKVDILKELLSFERAFAVKVYFFRPEGKWCYFEKH